MNFISTRNYDKVIMISNQDQMISNAAADRQEYPSFVSVSKNSHNDYHIQIVQPAGDQQILAFVSDFEIKQITLNKERDRATETTGLWVYLTQGKLHLVQQFCRKDYEIHHGLGKKIVLNKWIANRKNLVPPFSVFYVGCGAVLIKDDCVFLVQQRTGDRKGRFNVPGGRADPGQTIAECAQRELLEETNIKAKFKYILNFREASHSIYGCLDNYFACYMEFDDKALDEIQLCPNELNGFKWVPLSQYYDFTLKNSSQTQVELASCIAQLWKSGFDFKNQMPNLTNSHNTVIQQTSEIKKFVCHELINPKI